MGVDHGRLHVSVTHPVLDLQNVYPGRRHQGAERVAQVMKSERWKARRIERSLKPRRQRIRV